MTSKFTEEMFNKFGLYGEAKDLLLENAKYIKLKNKESLLTPGETCRMIWIVDSGCLKMFNNNNAGKKVNLSFGLPGDFITDLQSLRLCTGSENYIQSCSTSTVVALGKTKLQELYEQSNEIASFGRRVLEQLLSDQEEHANFLKLYTPIERYHSILSKRPLLFKYVSLTDLSSYLGMSRETLTRIRQAR